MWDRGCLKLLPFSRGHRSLPLALIDGGSDFAVKKKKQSYFLSQQQEPNQGSHHPSDMAFESLFSRPPNPVLDQNMTDSEHAGDTREDGELEDGEIDDGGIEEKTQEIQAAENPSIAKTRRKRRRRKRGKEKEKKKEKRRRREKHKQSFNSDNSSEYSCDSDTDYAERSSKETMYRDYDQVSQLDHVTLNYMNPSNAQQKKSANEYVDYGNNSDGNYNEEDEEDFAEQLKHYRQAKEHSNFCEPLNKSNYKGIHQGREQPPAGFYGRGRGIQKKDRGRGRGVHKGPKPYFQDGFQEGTKPIKKWVNLSQEFISQHTVEHKGKQICKYFLQERCYKGDQCKFHHEAEIGKWNEVCKFYVQGCCTKGDKCRYMHDEFPCKFYHTGAKCYQGDNCKFSHDPLTDESRDLLNKVLNTEEEVQHEDENGSEEMQRHGTPFYSPPFLGMQFQGSHHSMYGSDQLPECEPNVSQLTEKPLLQSDSCFANFSQTGATAPYNASSFPNHLTNNQRENISFSSPSFLQNPESKAQMMQQQNSYPSSQNTTGFFDNYYSQQAVYNAKSSSTPENDISNWYTSSEEEDGSGVTSILKTLRNQAKIARVNSTEQSLQSQTFDPRLAKDRAVRPQVSDPRVKCTQVENSKDPEETACTDPRFARDPRKMKSNEISPVININAGLDSQLVHSESKVKHKGIDEEEEDAERELRDKAAIIPLEMLPGVNLRDPRCKLRQFSHIKMDILLTKPHFAKLIAWAPEDLLPVPPPKQDHVSSINLPLPPLIADQTINKTKNDFHQSAPDPRLERQDPRAETKAKQATMAGRNGLDQADSVLIRKKLSDPRLQKNIQPRLQRTSISDSPPGTIKDSNTLKIDPRKAARTATDIPTGSCKPNQDVLPPYVPKLSTTNIRLGTPSSILKNISLYDPRDNGASAVVMDSTSVNETESHNSLMLTKHVDIQSKIETEHQDSSLQPSLSTETISPKNTTILHVTGEKNLNVLNENMVVLETAPSLPASSESKPSAAPAVHNLPIQALAGLIRPQYDPRQVRPTGQVNQIQESDPHNKTDEKPLRDVFKTFDPAASPFC